MVSQPVSFPGNAHYLLIHSNQKTIKMNKLKYYLFLSFALFYFTSCEDEDTHGLTAVATAEQEVSVGEMVALSAAASIDLNGDGFSSQWSFDAVFHCF